MPKSLLPSFRPLFLDGVIAVRGLFNYMYSCECTTPSVECLETQLQTSISSSFVFTCPLTDIVYKITQKETLKP